MNRFGRVGLVLLFAFIMILLPSWQAQAMDEHAATIAEGINSLISPLDNFSAIPELNQALPGTDANLVDELQYGQLFTDTLGVALANPGSFDTLPALQTAIDGADATVNGVMVSFNNVVVAENPTDNTLVDARFDVSMTRVDELPISLFIETPPTQPDQLIAGGTLAITASLTAEFSLQLDSNLLGGNSPDPANAFYLTESPALLFRVEADGDIDAFNGRFGFTEVSVTGTGQMNIGLGVTINDPDSNGRITRDEWENTTLEDLLTIGYIDQPNDDINIQLDLDNHLTTGSDGTIQLVDANLADGLTAPSFNLDPLSSFLNINRVDVLGGLSQLEGILTAAQFIGDLPLPMLSDNLSDVFHFTEPLLKFIRQQGDAAVLCGQTDTNPPMGLLLAARPGDNIYCRAITFEDPTDVTWHIEGGTADDNTSGADALNTVGTNPTINATFTITSTDTPTISVDFNDPDGAMHTVYPLFLTAQELRENLLALGGFDLAELNYNETADALTFHLQKSLIGTEPVAGTLDFGNYLQDGAGLFGLSHDESNADIEIEPADAQIDITFGILLGDDAGSSDVSDRFFIQTQEDTYELSANTTLTVTNLAMEGRLGFLKVTASGTGPTALSIGPQNLAEPMVGVNITPGDLNVGGVTISNAARLNDLVTGFASKVDATCNVGVSGGLTVSAALNNNTADVASGDLTFDWPDALTPTCEPYTSTLSIDPLPDFAHNLAVFNIDPENPAELLSIILNNLELLSNGLNQISGGDLGLLDTELPIIGENPRALIDQISNLQETIDELRLNPPNNLQELETALEAALNVTDPSILGFELADQYPPQPNGPDHATLLVHIGYDGEADYNDALKIDLEGDLPDLVTLEAGGEILIENDFQAQLDLGIPLNAVFIPGDIYVADTTGISLTTTVNTTNLDLTASIGPLSAEITGTAKLGANIGLDVTDKIPISDIATASDRITAGIDPIAQDCGEIIDLVDGVVQLEGSACANLGVNIINSSAGNIGFYAPDLTDPDSWETASSIDIENILQTTDLSLFLILEVLPEFMEDLEAQLYNGGNLPVVGKALDGGAHVVETLRDSVVEPLGDLADELGEVTDPANLTDIIRGGLADIIVPNARAAALEDIKILDRNGSGGNGDTDDIEVLCNGNDCSAWNLPISALNDVRVVFHVGQGLTSADDDPLSCPDCLLLDPIPFELNTGLPGLPLEGSGTLAVRGGWKLRVDFGLSRNDGPYLGIKDPTLTDAPEFELGVGAGLDDHPNCTTQPWPTAGQDPFFGDFSDSRCLHGVVGFLQTDLFDGDSNGEDNSPTNLGIETTIDLIKGTDDRVPLSQLGSLDIEPAFAATVNVDLRFRTGISDDVAGPGKLPSVVGGFHLAWTLDQDSIDDPLEVPTVEFDHLWLDAGGFISDFAGPALIEVKKITSPLKPVIDTLQAPLPGISHLAELVGGDPVTLLDIAKAIDDDPVKYQLIERVIDVIQFVNGLSDVGGDDHTFIPLGETPPPLSGIMAASAPGHFSVNAIEARNGPLTPDQAGKLVGANNAASDLIEQVDNAPEDVGGLSFPFLQGDKAAKNIFGLLMGQDITLIYFDAGRLKATAAYSQKFGPIFVGPIPISIGVHGSVSIEGHFAMGYDTAGIRKTFAGESVTELQKGIFIDDLKDGVDVPEIRLQGTIAASASIDAVIVEVGVKGGIKLTVDMNLDDSPDPDGKLRIDEIVSKLDNPFCLFDYSGYLDAFISAFARVGFGFLSKTFELEIVRVRLLEFSTACEPEEPVLYEMNGSTLILKMGAKAGGRNVQEDKPDEEFIVRQLSDKTCARFSVTAFGVHQESKEDECFSLLVADGGDGADVISLQPGMVVDMDEEGNDIENEYAFTMPAIIYGGSGNDRISTGWGDDTVCGGSGADRIDTSKGADTLYGDKPEGTSCSMSPYGFDAMADGGSDDNDNLSGGNDVDTIHGGGGADNISGGPAGDFIYGNGGDDVIQGGPSGVEEGEEFFTSDSSQAASYISSEHVIYLPVAGNNTDFSNSTTTLTYSEAQPDGPDTIIGGEGADTIAGHQSADIIYGDEESDDCEGPGEPGGSDDKIFGGPGDDKIWGGLGNDILVGEGGNDTICGNGGGDDLFGGNGRDRLNGGSGPDILLGDSGDLAEHTPADHESSMADVVALVQAGNETAVGPAIADCDDSISGEGNADCLFGGDGNDFLFGEGGHDKMYGEADDDYMDGNAGDDYMEGNADNDTMHGGQHNDTMRGNDDNDTMYGDSGDDYMEGNADNDTMRGGQDNDTMHGNDGSDTMYGDSGDDLMFGDNHDDTMRGGMGDDTMYGNADNDLMYGEADDDGMYGNMGQDEMYGNAGDDYMEGNQDHDTMFGGPDQDDMIGGSAGSGTADTNDDMNGNDGHDVMAGDNASITRPGGVNPADGSVLRVVVLHDLASGNSDTTAAGPDTMNGNGGNDQMYGQGEADIMHGNEGDDYMEGNGGSDLMHGDAQQDDLIGGTSQELGGTPDGSDTIYGDEDYDVILGDNAAITRLIVNDQWVVNTFNDAVSRHITLYDVATVLSTPPAVASGGDLLFGGTEDDLMYGQGNSDDADDDNDGLINEDPVDGLDNDGDGSTDEDPGGDYMHGDDGEDYLEGNAGSDWLFGDAGNDDMVGGTGRINDDPATGTNGRLDKGDTMFGGPGFDVMAGDNALLARTLVNGQWQSNSYNGGIQHEPRILLDIDSADTAVVSGPDTMYGNEDDDLMYGQGDDDSMFGNEGDDFMEGNAHSDTMYGNEDQDDMIGGTVQAGLTDEGDFMVGGGQGDVMLGDNGTIDRPVDGSGLWQIDPNTGDEIRDIHLLDVETISAPADPAVSGSDLMFGEDGRDFMFGQGNDALDSDGDGRFSEDPVDGLDNDRDGRESAASVGFDCLDGSDNDDDGLEDGSDPDCMAAVDEDGGGDEMHGGPGDDYMEGNHGADWMFGDDGEDDMIGGNSAGDGHIFGGVPPTNLTDGDDTMRGGSDDDQMIGDNGTIVRPADGSGLWSYLDGYGYHIVIRVVGMDQTPEDEGAFGHDHMRGDDGHDEMYGQLGADYLEGNNDEDAILGDLGLITSNIEDGSREEVIDIPAPFLEDTIYAAGTLYRLVELYAYEDGDGAEWDDTMLGGNGNDSIHGGAGDDLANGNSDEDHIFGGDGHDALWGGNGHDHLWGGHGDDYLDVKPRPADPGHRPPPGPPRPPSPADPPEWFTYARLENYEDIDTIYGGWDQDALQADVGGPGPQPGDRLLDWVGAYNVYYTCPAAYGEGVITRGHSPHVIQYLQQLSEADGAMATITDGTSGFRELAMVFPNQGGQNSHPPHPDHPGHFTCN